MTTQVHPGTKDVEGDELVCPPGDLLALAGVHPWYPISPCGEGCVSERAGRVGKVVAGWRVVRIIGVILFAAICGPFVSMCPRVVRRMYLRALARALLVAMGLRVEIDDRRPFVSHARGLVVANHVSYLDIAALTMVSPAHFVAKSEVAQMPVIATLARWFGVITIDRASLRALPGAIETAVERLHRDSAVAVFPEGTTRCGRTTGQFAPAFFEAAVRARVPVIPIRIDYLCGPLTATGPAFIGDDEPGDTLGRVLRAKGLILRVTIHESMLPGPDRRRFAQECGTLAATRQWDKT